MVNRLLLGGLWTAVGLAKAFSPEPFIRFVEDQVGTDPGGAGVVAWAFIVCELGLGIGLVAPRARHTRIITMLAILSLIAGLVTSAYVLLAPSSETACGCFGVIIRATNGRRLLVAAAVVFLSAQVLRRGRPTPGPSFRRGAPQGRPTC